MDAAEIKAKLEEYGRRITRAQATMEANQQTVDRLLPQQEALEAECKKEYGVGIADLPEYIAAHEADLESALELFGQSLAEAAQGEPQEASDAA